MHQLTFADMAYDDFSHVNVIQTLISFLLTKRAKLFNGLVWVMPIEYLSCSNPLYLLKLCSDHLSKDCLGNLYKDTTTARL